MDVAMMELGHRSFAEVDERFLARSQDHCSPMLTEEIVQEREEQGQARAGSQGLSCSLPLPRERGAAACAAPATTRTGFRDMPRHKPRQQPPLLRARTHEEPLLRQLLVHLHLKRQEEEHRLLARFHQQQQQQQEQQLQQEQEQQLLLQQGHLEHLEQAQEEQEWQEQARQEQLLWHWEQEQQRLEGVLEHPLWGEATGTREQEEEGSLGWREDVPSAMEDQDQDHPCTEGSVLEGQGATAQQQGAVETTCDEPQSLFEPCWEQNMQGNEVDLAATDVLSCWPLPGPGHSTPVHKEPARGGSPNVADHLSVCRGLWSHQGQQGEVQLQTLERAQSLPALPSYWGPTFLGEQGQSVAQPALYSLPGGVGAANKLQEVSLPLCFLPNYWDDQSWRLELPEDGYEEEHLSSYLPQLGLF